MQRKWLLLAAGAMLSTIIVGCSENHGELGNRNIRQNSVREDGNGNIIIKNRFANDQMNERNRMDGRRLNSNNIIGSHRNYQLEMNVEMSEQVSALPGVGESYVMLTDHNAYVAVSSQEQPARPRAQSQNGQMKPLSRTDMAYISPSTLRAHGSTNTTTTRYDQEMEHSSRHLDARGRFDSTKSYDSTKITRLPASGISPYAAGSGQLSTNGYRTSKEYDMYGSGYQPVRPYGALNASPGQIMPVSSNTQERIAAEIRKLDPSIEHIYVSSNNDFVHRMSTYMEDVRLGHPIQAYIAEFNALVERTFPPQPAGRK